MSKRKYVGLDSLAYFFGKLTATFAAITHKHAASDITSGTLPLARGGTGATNATDALVNLGALGTRTTTGPAYGPLASVTAEGHAEQDGTPTPSDPKEIVVVRGHEVAGKTGRYVDLVVTADGTTTTTPIPLPSRGWVGSLPDGTHDALSIDGAGKVTWELGVGKYEVTGSETIADALDLGTNYRISLTKALQNFRVGSGTNGMSDVLAIKDGWTTDTTGFFYNLAAGRGHINCFVPNVDTTADALTAVTGAEFYYPLTPTTVDVGYVDIPDIPDGAVVSMPELEGLGVESWTSDAVARYVRAWAARS